MPSGIILSSGSEGATKEAIEKVLTDNGYEADKPEAQEPVELVEPKREDFETDEEFDQAQADHEAAVEKAEEEQEEQEEKEAEAAQARQEARHKLSRRERAIAKATKPLQDQIKKLEEQIAAVNGKKPAAEPEPPKLVAPKREDFKSDAEFEDALFDYRYKVRRAKEQVDATKEAQEKQQKQLNERLKENYSAYQTSVADFKETHDDWEAVVGQPHPIPEAVYFSIVDLGKDGPAVTYYLGKHPEKLEELGEMTPYRAAIEVGRISDRLKGGKNASTGEKPKPKPRTLPPPPRTLSTAATNSSLSSREAAKKGDFKAFKRAQQSGR